MNSVLEVARCPELLLSVSLGHITLYIKLTQDFSVTLWNSILFAFMLVDTNIPSAYGCWVFYVKHQAVFQFYFNFKSWLSVFIFALVSPERTHLKIWNYSIIQAQNFCSRKSCHYIEEGSPQKNNNILIKMRCKFACSLSPLFCLGSDWRKAVEDLTSKKTSLPALLCTVAEMCVQQAYEEHG